MSAITNMRSSQRDVRVLDVDISTRYAWRYDTLSEKVEHLYKLGNEKAWDPDRAIDWSRALPPHLSPVTQQFNPYLIYQPYLELPEADRVVFDRKRQAWSVSQILHGEQGALLVASQLVSCLPEYEAKLYAASQAFDEARHVYVFSRYLKDHARYLYPIDANLENLIDQLLLDERWDLKFLGMQVIVEGLALAAFDNMRKNSVDPLLLDIVNLVLADESRHVNFGVYRLKDHLQSITDAELIERAEFAYYACTVLESRLFPGAVFEEFGMNVDEAKSIFLNSPMWRTFIVGVFSKIVPNLQRLGLLIPEYVPKYRALGALPDTSAEGAPPESDWRT